MSSGLTSAVSAEKLLLLQKRHQQEQEYNKRAVFSKFGEFVVYGNEIELRHVDSGSKSPSCARD